MEGGGGGGGGGGVGGWWERVKGCGRGREEDVEGCGGRMEEVECRNGWTNLNCAINSSMRE